MSRTIFLTSSLDMTEENLSGQKVAHKFTNLNHIQEKFKKYIKNFNNFLYIASIENNNENNDLRFKLTKQSFDLTMPFKNYFLLDGRTKNIAQKLIDKADFIFLCGGHVPTQNKFFKNINLSALLQDYKGVICGASAGSMNCAKQVYSPPELEGEAIDKNFVKYFEGIGLTNINIMPHFDDVKDTLLDGKHFLKDILLLDSFKTKIIAYSDGTYILLSNNQATIYGQAYQIFRGKIKQLCKKRKKLNNII